MSNIEDTDIKIYNQKPKKENNEKNTFIKLKWFNKLVKAITNKKEDRPISVKKGLRREEMLHNAQIHRQANRPLKKIKEFDGSTKFCQCCYNPMKDKIHVTNFNFCDSGTDEFAEFGKGISLYFFYIKYSIFILLISFCLMSLPCIIISKKCTEELIDMCELIYFKEEDNKNTTSPFCEGFTNIDKKSMINNNQLIFLLKFNSMNLKQYRDLYLNITNNNKEIDKIIINYNLIYFICLITLFIIHSIYMLLLFNINKQYDMNVTSPSDYAVMIINLQSSFEILFSEINKINKSIRNNSKNNINFNMQEYNQQSSRKIYKKFREIGLEKLDLNNKISINEGFNEFIKNIICKNEEGEQFDIHIINICYKINEFKLTKEEIEKYSNQLYIANNDPEQKIKNSNLNSSDDEDKYFYYPFDFLDLYICPFTLYEESIEISELEEKKKKLEKKLKVLLKSTEKLTEANFSGVIFIIFNSMKEKEIFLEIHNNNSINGLIQSLLNLKYYLCSCCIKPSKRKEYFLKHNISIEEAPEPEDVIFENLEFSWVKRLSRVLLAYSISFILIIICFFLILYLNNIQIKNSRSGHESIIYRYILSASISLIIAVINSIFQKIFFVLTKVEKQICMTNLLLSYSIKITIFTFFSSAIIPFLASNYYNKQLNHDILITNCLTMFLSNSFLIPITWSINFECVSKKLRRCIIRKKRKRLPQKELNTLFELLDMDIASKYSYTTRTLLMCFFYLPIFPLGIPICFIGFIFSFFLEKYNFVKMYKKPIMLNSKIIEFYSNYFIINLLMVSLGDYFFLENVFKSNLWISVNLILFSILTILPYNKVLSIDLIKINESDIKAEELYEDYFYNFFNDYERNNPITKKEGIKHFLDKLLEKFLITKNEYDNILQNYEQMNLLEIYYKSKLHFGLNIIKRALYLRNSEKNLLEENANIKDKTDSININLKKQNLISSRNNNIFEIEEEKKFNSRNNYNIINLKSNCDSKISFVSSRRSKIGKK